MRRQVLGVGLVLAVLAGAWGCGEDRAPVPVMADAGPGCLRGTQGCLCTLEDGCESRLLCIANRCLSLEGNTGGTAADPVRPSPGAGGSAGAGGSVGGGGSAGVGGTSGGSSDASAPDAAPGNGGATDAAVTLPDASTTDASL